MTAQYIAPVIPSSAVQAARRQGRSAANRPLPLRHPARSVLHDGVYGLARIDASGRFCVATALRSRGIRGSNEALSALALRLSSELGTVGCS